MHLITALGAAALSAGVANADFFVYTTPPIPLSAIPTFADPTSSGEWTTSVAIAFNFAYGDFTDALGEPYQSSISSAASEIKDFVASASNYSIPAAVTDPETTTTITGAPDWYSALPSKARAFKESQVSDQFSIVRSVINRDATTGAGADAAGSTGGAMPTPMAGLGAGFGAMAAVAAGVFL